MALDDVELRATADRAAGSAGGDLLGRASTTAASHALGKAYRDVVRGFRGEFPHPPDVVARPREEAEVEHLLSWCADAGAVAIPFGGGTSVVGGVEARDIDRPVVTIDLRALTEVLEVDATRAPRESRRAPPARCSRSSSSSTA